MIFLSCFWKKLWEMILGLSCVWTHIFNIYIEKIKIWSFVWRNYSKSLFFNVGHNQWEKQFRNNWPIISPENGKNNHLCYQVVLTQPKPGPQSHKTRKVFRICRLTVVYLLHIQLNSVIFILSTYVLMHLI